MSALGVARLRVLVVDDSETVRAVVVQALEGADVDIVEATDGEEALLLAHLHRPDVVLMDVHMPNMDGMTALRALRADASVTDIPVVMLTQQDSPDDVAAALDAGAYDFLGKPFSPVELRARVSAAGRTGQLVGELRRLNAQLERMARTDTLTGLANRRAIDQGLHDRIGDPVTLMLLDVDHFKSVNDRYGHAIGDVVLRRVSDRLRDCLRSDDIVGRWGGEEFVIVMRGMDPATAHAACDRILAAVRAPLDVPDGPPSVTLSIGVATSADRMADVDALLRDADAALYQAKRNGRDRAELAGP